MPWSIFIINRYMKRIIAYLESIPSLRRLGMAVAHFLKHNLMSHASALCYSSILGAVPILAIVMAIARGFGFGQLIEEKIANIAALSSEMAETVMSFVNNYLEYARGGVFVGIGLLLLFYTLFNLTSDIETAFNTIWEVRTSRNIFRRAVSYVSVFFFLPVVIIITSGLQLFLAGIARFLPDYEFVSHGFQLLMQLLPYALSGVAFIFLYKLMPNTEVHWRATIVPGFLAGAAFQGLQWVYIYSQVWLSSYNAIYGTFAAIPLFMLIVQLSWTIVLFGGALSYVHQHEADLLAAKQKPASAKPIDAEKADETIARIKDLIAAYEKGCVDK